MRGKFRLFWLILAVLFAGMAGVACFYAAMYGSIYNRPDADPAETVTRFFDSVRARNYPEAYACLSDYASLGLEQEPESTEARAMYEALRNSYSYTLSGSSSVTGLEASQRVVLRALNLRMTENAVQQRVNGILEELVTTMPESEIYDGNGGYLTSFTDTIYKEALNQALQNTDTLCSDTQLLIQLKYMDGTWKIVTDRNLMTALIGGEN